MVLRIPGPQGVLGLKRSDRGHAMRTPDRVGASLGQTDEAHLALGDELTQKANGFLNWGTRVHPVLVVEVDVVSPEALERTVDRDANALGAAVRDPTLSSRVREDAELRGHHHLVSSALDGPTHQFLAVEWSIDLGGVDVGDAQFERSVDGADRLVVVEAST